MVWCVILGLEIIRMVWYLFWHSFTVLLPEGKASVSWASISFQQLLFDFTLHPLTPKCHYSTFFSLFIQFHKEQGFSQCPVGLSGPFDIFRRHFEGLAGCSKVMNKIKIQTGWRFARFRTILRMVIEIHFLMWFGFLATYWFLATYKCNKHSINIGNSFHKESQRQWVFKLGIVCPKRPTGAVTLLSLYTGGLCWWHILIFP